MSRRAACLLLHGFGGGPFEMAPLARVLADAGLAVQAPTLPGHDENIEAFARTRWNDWLQAARSHYERLAAEHERVVLVGQSMGGSLALRLAQLFRPAGVALLAAPVFLYSFHPWAMRSPLMPFMGLLRKVRPVWRTGPGNPRSREIAPWRGYEGAVPLEALHSFNLGLRQVRRDLAEVRAPLLVVHAKGDRNVPVANAWEIARRSASPVSRVALLEIRERVTSHHLLTTHVEVKELVAGMCREFCLEILAGEGGAAPLTGLPYSDQY